MSLFAQRQEQRLRLLISIPALTIALIAGLTLLLAGRAGVQPREGMLDLITTLSPRPAGDLPVAMILVDEESEAKIGTWPWPRSALGRLVDVAEEAGAASVTLAISVAGPDPLSPDMVAERWLAVPGIVLEDEISVLSNLPSNDLLLARALAGGPVGIGVAPVLFRTSQSVAWQAVPAEMPPWLTAAIPSGPKEAIFLPSTPPYGLLSAELQEAQVLAVVGFPEDPGGRVRHAAPLYWAEGQPAATAGLATLMAAGQRMQLTFRDSLLTNVDAMPASLQVGNGSPLTLNSRSEFRLWFPKSVSVPSVSAWRALTDASVWASSLRGRHVIIGETLTRRGTVRTARGTMPAAQLHALTAQQMAMGAAPIRPVWASFAEAGAALAIGMLTILAVIFLPPIVAVVVVVLVGLMAFGAAFGTFTSTGLLFDPSPSILAGFLGPLAVGGTVLANMVVRDDQVRGAFHGALPQKAMRRVQSAGGRRLLAGVHRDVTVLSCALQLPKPLLERFRSDAEAYMAFQASANDRLRRTILDHQGTVDYGEDGRLLGYWNVPIEEDKHVQLACSCALKMLDDVSTMSQQVNDGHHLSSDSGAGDLSDGRIEIGIATGPCFAGPAGLGGRNRYAALGQPVSFAGRLRARSELYGPAILTDARVFEALRHHYAFLDLDLVRQDNEAQAEVIYGLVGNPFLKASKTFRDLAEVQRGLLDAWRNQDLATATRQLQKLRGIPGVPQPYVELFERRIMNARLAKARRQTDTAEVLGP